MDIINRLSEIQVVVVKYSDSWGSSVKTVLKDEGVGLNRISYSKAYPWRRQQAWV